MKTKIKLADTDKDLCKRVYDIAYLLEHYSGVALVDKLGVYIAKAEQQTRTEALEEAAKIADGYIDACLATDYENGCFKRIANEIRARIDK